MSFSVALTDETGNVDMGGWPEGYVPRVGEGVDLSQGRFVVTQVRYRLTVGTGPTYTSRVLTAFVFLKAE